MKRALLGGLAALALFAAPAWSSSPTRVFFTSTTTWTVPADFNAQTSSAECIGGGAAGTNDGNGLSGGGGAYAKILNRAWAPGSTVSVTIGAGGSPGPSGNTGGGDSWMETTAVLFAQGALGNGVGGSAASSVGSTKFSGGTGSGSLCGAGNGGAGAAGPNGAGGNSLGACVTGNGAAGDNGLGGAGGTGSGPGGAGTEIDGVHGSGGGGSLNGVGGAYGGGGGSQTFGTGFNGAPGLCWVSYFPARRVSTSVF